MGWFPLSQAKASILVRDPEPLPSLIPSELALNSSFTSPNSAELRPFSLNTFLSISQPLSFQFLLITVHAISPASTAMSPTLLT